MKEVVIPIEFTDFVIHAGADFTIDSVSIKDQKMFLVKGHSFLKDNVRNRYEIYQVGTPIVNLHLKELQYVSQKGSWAYYFYKVIV